MFWRSLVSLLGWKIKRGVNVVVYDSYISAEINSPNGRILLEVIDLIKTNDEGKVKEKLKPLSVSVTDIQKIGYRKIKEDIFLWTVK